MSRCSECSLAEPNEVGKTFSKFWMVLALAFAIAVTAAVSSAQQGRKHVSNPQPEFPEVAKRMNLSGVVKVEIVIGADGEIKDTKIVGGHPVLVDAVQKALKKWKYAPGGSETREMLEFRF